MSKTFVILLLACIALTSAGFARRDSKKLLQLSSCDTTNRSTCEDSGCQWCDHRFAPPTCIMISAKDLPAFSCPSPSGVSTEDRSANTSESEAEAANANDCATLVANDTCNADAQCVWCKSGAIKSKCYPADLAKKLPPGVFVCDK